MMAERIRWPVANLLPDPPFPDSWMNLPGHVTTGERVRLRDLALDVPTGGVILEIGSWLGASLSCLLTGSKQQRCIVHSIDTGYVGNLGERQKEVMHAYGVNDARVRRWAGTSRQVGLRWSTRLDLAFIGGSHDPEDLRMDLQVYAKAIKPGGVVAMHDVRLPPLAEVPDWLNRARNLPGLVRTLAPVVDRWAAGGSWTELEPAHTIRVFRKAA